jgi:hypothetical protein
MTRMTEEELLAKSAKNRKAKAETWSARLTFKGVPIEVGETKLIDGQLITNSSPQTVFVEKNKGAEVAHVSKSGKVGKFKPIIPTEHQEQCKVIEWCDQHPIAKHIFAIPNGANKSPATAAKFKREGLRKGVPDLFLPVARMGFHGLFVEMKRVKGSVLSVDQALQITSLEGYGYLCHVCHGADEAIAVIQDYLKED